MQSVHPLYFFSPAFVLFAQYFFIRSDMAFVWTSLIFSVPLGLEGWVKTEKWTFLPPTKHQKLGIFK